MAALSVFVIEDSQMLRERILESLERVPELEVVGYAESQREAIEKILTLRPAVVVADIKLKEGNGLAVIAALRADARAQGIKVVVFTNFARSEYQRIAQRLAVDFFLDKSTQFAELPKVLVGMAAH